MRLPNPHRSYAVLIGAGTYQSAELPDLPAVRNNLDALAGVLTDPKLGGLPAERCVVVADRGDVRAVYRTLRQCATNAEDTLLVYFAGHGRTGPRNELYLCLSGTEPAELGVSALTFELVREVFGESPATSRVLILDCCFSGRAIADMAGDAEFVLGQVGIDGTYTLTATPANAVALAPVGAQYTAFTGQLLNLLRAGVPGGPELLNFGTLYPHLRRTMARLGLPAPQQRGTGTVDQLALTRNTAYGRDRDPATTTLPVVAPDPAPASSRRGRVQRPAALAAAMVVLVATSSVVWWFRSREQATADGHRRGQILAGQDAVASSILTPSGQRSYPFGARYAHVVGSAAPDVPATGVEKLEEAALSGGDEVVLTVRNSVQDAAFNGLRSNFLGAKKGAVVAIAPATGAVLAMTSIPSVDPNLFVTEKTAAFQQVERDPSQPLMNRAVSRAYPPGAVFMPVVAAAALTAKARLNVSADAIGDEYKVPGTSMVIRNRVAGLCWGEGTVQRALPDACEVTFARLAVENLGISKIDAAAKGFGFGDVPALERDSGNAMQVAASKVGPVAGTDRKSIAQVGVGSAHVSMTPLQAAMMVSAIVNKGTQMRPYVVGSVLKPDRTAAFKATPVKLRQSVSAPVAAELRVLLRKAVDEGAADMARTDGLEVGGMTGNSYDDKDSYGWFVGYAVKDNKPVVAVAVVVEGLLVDGNRQAARIGTDVMRTAAIASTS